MLMNKVLKRASLLFLALSAGLWSVRFYLYEEKKEVCQEPLTETTIATLNGADHSIAEDPSKWFHSQISSFSPTHLKLHSSCPALNDSTYLHPDTHLLYPQEGEYLGTLSVIGEVLLSLNDKMRIQDKWLRNISELIQDTSAVLTSFSVSVHKDDIRPEILRDLKSLGRTVIVSLANTVSSRQVTGSENVRVMSRALEWAGIDWLGVYAKQHHILILGSGEGERAGILAFCGVQNQCTDTPNLAFSPVKYTLKLAKSAINELNEHGVAVILVIIYWGLETSYFPDETALSIARQLSKLGVAAILGYHPNSVHHHAYYGNTLVIFSSGRILSSNRISHFCWRKVSGKWVYSSSRHCEVIHPQNRDRLFHREHKSRIYKLHLSRIHPVLAEYVTLELDDHDTGHHNFIRRPTTITSHAEWTRVCSHSDTQCLTCNPF